MPRMMPTTIDGQCRKGSSRKRSWQAIGPWGKPKSDLRREDTRAAVTPPVAAETGNAGGIWTQQNTAACGKNMEVINFRCKKPRSSHTSAGTRTSDNSHAFQMAFWSRAAKPTPTAKWLMAADFAYPTPSVLQSVNHPEECPVAWAA